jgi:hypothetical protein
MDTSIVVNSGLTALVGTLLILVVTTQNRSLRAEMRAEIGALRSEMTAGFAALRKEFAEMKQDLRDLRAEVVTIRSDLTAVALAVP